MGDIMLIGQVLSARIESVPTEDGHLCNLGKMICKMIEELEILYAWFLHYVVYGFIYLKYIRCKIYNRFIGCTFLISNCILLISCTFLNKWWMVLELMKAVNNLWF